MLVVDIERMPSYQIGLEQGIEANKIENAKKMLMMGFDIETIHKITDLSIDKIKQLSSDSFDNRVDNNLNS